MSIAVRRSITVPADGKYLPIQVRGRVVYVEGSPDNTPEGVPTFHLNAGGYGIGLYSRSALAWLPGFSQFYVRGTAAAAGSTLYLLIYEDPCAEGVRGQGAVFAPNPCPDPVAEAFAYPSQPTDLLYNEQGNGLRLAGVHNESPVTIVGGDAAVAAAYSPVDDVIYYQPYNSAAIRKVNPDGTGDANVGTLQTGTIQPYDMMLDADGEHMLLWYRRNSGGGSFDALYLRRYPLPLDVADFEEVFKTSDSNGSNGGLTIDIDRQLYYLANTGSGAGSGRIRSVAWDGSINTTLYTPALTDDNLTGIAYDPVDDLIYFMDNDNDVLNSMNPDGTGVSAVVGFGASTEKVHMVIGGRYLLVSLIDGSVIEYLVDGTAHATIRAADAVRVNFAKLIER